MLFSIVKVSHSLLWWENEFNKGLVNLFVLLLPKKMTSMSLISKKSFSSILPASKILLKIMLRKRFNNKKQLNNKQEEIDFLSTKNVKKTKQISKRKFSTLQRKRNYNRFWSKKCKNCRRMEIKLVTITLLESLK